MGGWSWDFFDTLKKVQLPGIYSVKKINNTPVSNSRAGIENGSSVAGHYRTHSLPSCGIWVSTLVRVETSGRHYHTSPWCPRSLESATNKNIKIKLQFKRVKPMERPVTLDLGIFVMHFIAFIVFSSGIDPVGFIWSSGDIRSGPVPWNALSNHNIREVLFSRNK